MRPWGDRAVYVPYVRQTTMRFPKDTTGHRPPAGHRGALEQPPTRVQTEFIRHCLAGTLAYAGCVGGTWSAIEQQPARSASLRSRLFWSDERLAFCSGDPKVGHFQNDESLGSNQQWLGHLACVRDRADRPRGPWSAQRRVSRLTKNRSEQISNKTRREGESSSSQQLSRHSCSLL